MPGGLEGTCDPRPEAAGLLPHPEAQGFYDFGLNGSYMVVRELRQDGASYGERFDGQTVSFVSRESGLPADFDALGGVPTTPLNVLAGPAGQNLYVNKNASTGNVILLGCGPRTCADQDGRGEGAVSIELEADTNVLAFDVTLVKPLDRGEQGNPFGVQLFARDGSVLGSFSLRFRTNTRLGFRTTSAQRIAGVSLTNPDPDGVGFDNFSFNQLTTEPGLDTDGDGVTDDQDVCAGGDDLQDGDGDRVPDFCDACPFDPDNDADGDGFCAFDAAGPLDNCPAIANPDQTDTDGDGAGDACDPHVVQDNSVTGALTETFEGLAVGGRDGVLALDGASYGERFAGQTLTFRSRESGLPADFDALGGVPNDPLNVLAGPAGQNLYVNKNASTGNVVLLGCGPTGCGSGGERGQGAVSILLGADTNVLAFSVVLVQTRLDKFDLGDPLDVQLFARDGSLLGSFSRRLRSNTRLGFRTTSAQQRIAGVSLTNLDPGGVGFDNFSFNEFTTEPGLDTDGDGVPDDQDVCAGGNDLEDVDGDRVPDSCDLCPFDPDNDADEDGLCAFDEAGPLDACPFDPDNDADGDGLCAFDEAGPLDTCPFDPGNDADEDGLCALDQTGAAPDACPFDPDNDADQDGLCGEVDNCPASANPDQTGTDGDLEGDACDLDDDDGVEDTAENCVLHANPDQSDRDGDSAGDVCDADRDGDGVGDDADACLLTQTGDVVDATGCSVADRCPCGNEWKNHGAYLSCVGRTARNFVGGGLITVLEEGAINSAAVNSQCGERR